MIGHVVLGGTVARLATFSVKTSLLVAPAGSATEKLWMSCAGSWLVSSPVASVTSVTPGTAHRLSTTVCVRAELFDGSGSALVVESDALFANAPPEPACTLITIVSRSPAGRLPRLQTTVVATVHDPAL